MTTSVNLRRHNLNALPVLREILRHKNLTAAARSLNLTQPTLSNLLKQLRAEFGDQLIVRDGQQMRLTPKGEHLLAPLEQALSGMEELIAGTNFDPATSGAQFNVGATDHVMAVLGARLLTMLEAEAPALRLRFHLARLGLIRDMMAGDIDIMIVPRMLIAAGMTDAITLRSVSTESLFTEKLIGIARADDDEVRAGLSRERYLARAHLGYFNESRVHISVEQALLASHGLDQQDRMLTTSYVILPQLVAGSRAIALVPERLAKEAAMRLPIQCFTPPVPFPDLEWVMAWPKRREDDPKLIWLRAALKHAAEDAA